MFHKAGGALNMIKCRLFHGRVDYLGHKILPENMADET